MLVAWPIASTLVGRHLERIGFRAPARAGAFCTALGALLIAVRSSSEMSLPLIYTASGIMGFGLGLSITPLLIAVQNSVPWERRGVATAGSLFFRTMGGSLAAGGCGALLASHLRMSAAPETVALLLGPARAQVLGAPGGAELKLALQHGLTLVFWTAAGMGLLALLASLAFPKTAPSRGNET